MRAYIARVEPIRLGVNRLLDRADPILSAFQECRLGPRAAQRRFDRLERRFAAFAERIAALRESPVGLRSASRPGVPVAFDASASSDPDGTIAGYLWSFGDGNGAETGGPTPRHTFVKPGSYQVTLTVTDNEGCSTALIFTGQTAYCNGSVTASQVRTVNVAYPGVRLKCPKRARPKGCKFKLQAVSKKRKGKAESAVSKASAKGGKSAIVSLKPRKAYRNKLATAKRILVKETVTIDGARQTLFRNLKVVR